MLLGCVGDGGALVVGVDGLLFVDDGGVVVERMVLLPAPFEVLFWLVELAVGAPDGAPLDPEHVPN